MEIIKHEVLSSHYSIEHPTLKNNIIEAIYFFSSFLFILSLGGLSKQESSKRGNVLGVLGMLVSIIITFFIEGFHDEDFAKFFIPFCVGGAIGLTLALRVKMIDMPQLIAILHSFVGFAATILGFSEFLKNKDDTTILKLIETAIEICIGSVTFIGSVIAWGKLEGKLSSSPLILFGKFRHFLNLILLCVIITLGGLFVTYKQVGYLAGICGVSLFLGWHLIMAIGGADMPVVVSMLNSYSGWTTSASGFMLNNNILIISGALIGSSGAILSYIMCRAMNRSLLSVIMGGFGIEVDTGDQAPVGEIKEAQTKEVSDELIKARKIVIVPGFGMAVSQAQGAVGALVKRLKELGKECKFCIHPVAGRLPGHMNVLLAEANVPYDIVHESEELNKEFDKIDVVLVIGANDIVNPDALENPRSPIAGMPVCEVWKAKKVFVIKRGMGKGYAAIENLLFFKENCRMYFGNASAKINELLKEISTSKGADVKIESKTEADNENNEEEDLEDMTPFKKNFFKTVGIPREVYPGEKRVALTPKIARKLVKLGFRINIEDDAGFEAGYSNEEYEKAGANIVKTSDLWENSEIILKVRAPNENKRLGYHEAEALQKTKLLISYIYPLQNKDLIDTLLKRDGITVFALDCVPRITRAQKLDTLSSMTNVAGYRATVEGFNNLPRFSKLQVTAAGKILPARVFVLGAGVAGLASIGVAKSLGAIVKAFDSRSVVKEQIESLGAEFVSFEYKEDGAGQGGYAKEMSPQYYEAQKECLSKVLRNVDLVITTALIPGKKAPILIDEKMVHLMKPMTVIVDMAAEMGGNCELTRKGEIYTDPKSRVNIIGYFDYPSRMARQSSELFAMNMYNLFEELLDIPKNPANKADKYRVNPEDEIVNGLTVIFEGKYVYGAADHKALVKVASSNAPVANKPISKEEHIVIMEISENANLLNGRKSLAWVQELFVLFLICCLCGLYILIAWGTDVDFIVRIGIFILSVFVGYMVVWNVTASLHTPLMSVTNAISGIIIVGCMQSTSQPESDRGKFFEDYSVLSFIGIFFASINILGGFVVTQRMLRMFSK